jgi:hypothetical protein
MKRHQLVLHRFSPQIAGMILHVKELVEVWNVTEEEGRRKVEKSRSNSEGSGVEVDGLAWGGGRVRDRDVDGRSMI